MRHIRPVSDEISINWRLTNFCNYACSYCPDVLHDKSDKIYDLFYYKNQIDKLINQLPSSIPIKLFFDGGEATQVKCLLDLCKYLSSAYPNIELTVASNGSKPLKYYLELSKYVKVFSFSLHFEYVKLKPFTRKIYELTKRLGSDRVYTQVMAEVGYYNVCKKTCEFFSKRGFYFDLCTVTYETPGAETIGKKILYSQKWLDLIEKYSTSPAQKFDMYVDNQLENSSIFKNKIRHDVNVFGRTEGLFKDWKCFAPSKVFLLEKGVLFGSTCRILEYSDDFKIVESIICDGRSCHCTTSLRAEKFVNK